MKRSIGIDAPAEAKKVAELTELTAELISRQEALAAAVAAQPEDVIECATYDHEMIIPAMEAARRVADELEMKVAKRAWPMPTYAELLYYV